MNRFFQVVLVLSSFVFFTLSWAESPAQPPAQLATTSPHGGQPASKPAIDFKTIKVPKATGKDAKTVAEVFAQKGELKDKGVSVRGQVTKYLPGIMGKNWIHLSDGTGTETAKDFDLVVTSKEVTKVGDVIQIKGKVRTDRDFGAGYRYAVLVEEAKLSK